jgi:mRNA interferase RelE/StbE
MAYAIEFASSALREFKALDRAIQRRVATHIDEFAANPFPLGSKKLQGATGQSRIRIADYRVIYRVDGKRVTILILKIGHRREIDR